LFLFRLILNIVAKVALYSYGICRNLYGFNRNMFKTEIREPEDILLLGKFDESDYPLVSFVFSDTMVKWEEVKEPVTKRSSERKKENTYLVDISVSKQVLLKINGLRQIIFNSESGLNPVSEMLSPIMRSIIFDILNCPFSTALKASYLKAKVAELLIQVLSVQVRSSSTQTVSEQDRRSLEKVRDLLSRNLKASYSIEELAVIAGMNRTKLQHEFKNLFSKTIYTFLLDLKMTEAKTMLTKENKLSLKEIAASLGYKHANHFSAAFKKKFSLSPAHFKKSS